MRHDFTDDLSLPRCEISQRLGPATGTMDIPGPFADVVYAAHSNVEKHWLPIFMHIGPRNNIYNYDIVVATRGRDSLTMVRRPFFLSDATLEKAALLPAAGLCKILATPSVGSRGHPWRSSTAICSYTCSTMPTSLFVYIIVCKQKHNEVCDTWGLRGSRPAIVSFSSLA